MTQTKNTTTITDAACVADYTGMCTPRQVLVTDKIHSLIIAKQWQRQFLGKKKKKKKAIARAHTAATQPQHNVTLGPLSYSNVGARNWASATSQQ